MQVDKSTGIADISAAIDAINVTPNPTSGQTTVTLEATAETTITVELYDMTGRLISYLYSGSLEVGKKNITFSTDNLTSGVYLIKANDGKASLQKRFVKL